MHEHWSRRDEPRRHEMIGRGYREKDYRDYRSDYYRNPYEDEGYVDRAYKSHNAPNDYPIHDSKDYGPHEDYRHDMYGKRYDEHHRDDYHFGESEYKHHLHKWKMELESKRRFMQSEEEVIKRAKEMGIQFGQFTEEEFYVTYLLMQTMFYSVSNDFNMYISIAKEFLHEKGIKVSPSEKLSIYLYYIVEGNVDEI